jgi:hypothetical protein
VAASSLRLNLRLLGDLQCIVDLDAEIPDGTFELRVSKQELNGPEIPSPPIKTLRGVDKAPWAPT